LRAKIGSFREKIHSLRTNHWALSPGVGTFVRKVSCQKTSGMV
jgi:hypothetical protein